MSEERKLPEERTDGSAFERFEKLTRALFRVDKRDIPKHEPVKREKRSSTLPNE